MITGYPAVEDMCDMLGVDVNDYPSKDSITNRGVTLVDLLRNVVAKVNKTSDGGLERDQILRLPVVRCINKVIAACKYVKACLNIMSASDAQIGTVEAMSDYMMLDDKSFQALPSTCQVLLHIYNHMHDNGCRHVGELVYKPKMLGNVFTHTWEENGTVEDAYNRLNTLG